MNHADTRKFIAHSSLLAVGLSLLIGFSVAERSLQRSAELQAQVFNQQLASFVSALTGLASFLAEPGDLNHDGLVVKRLNRFVYGNPGILAIQLVTSRATFQNSNSSSGQFINDRPILPECGIKDFTEDTWASPRLIGCEDGRLALVQRFEDFNGKSFALKLVLNLESVPGSSFIHTQIGKVSNDARCSVVRNSMTACTASSGPVFSRAFAEEFFPVFLILLVTLGILAVLSVRLVIIPFRTMNEALEKARDASPELTEQWAENRGILRLLHRPVSTINALLHKKTELEQRNAAARARDKIAEEVVHNIRSPLAALHGVEAELGDLAADAKTAFRSAVSRIEDIVNLLDPCCLGTVPSADQKYLVSSLVSVLLSEKRRQYADRDDLNFSIDDKDQYGIFAEVDSTAFKTVLSNLINNAVEAVPADRPGSVTVKLSTCDSFCEVSVIDNGIGMSKIVQQQAMLDGYTHGKEHGKGVGLFHAATMLRSWNGELSIHSTPGVGTEIKLRLPKTNPPRWFVPSVEIAVGSRVAVLDDDISVHHLWKSRLGALSTVVCFSRADAFKNAIISGEDFSVLLVDYELIGEKTTGLSLIQELGLAERTILVTSRFEDGSIRETCEKIGLRLLPKTLATQVPIHRIGCTSETKAPNQSIVLLDDDALVHQVWKMSARRLDIEVTSFFSVESLFDALPGIAKTTPIFVDFNLKNSRNGLQVCESLYELGYENLTLATGIAVSDLPSWLKLVGKRAPFRKEEVRGLSTATFS